MPEPLHYGDHVQHYKMDAAYHDYFTTDPFSEQDIRRRYQAFFQLCPLQLGERILEIGSGGGPALAELNGSDACYVPTDLAGNNLTRMRSQAACPIFPALADTYALPFVDYCFDRVIISEVLEHLERPEQAVCEAARVARPNATVLISVPYREKISYQICIHCNRPTPTHAHLHSFDEHNLSRLIEAGGLTVKRTYKLCNKVASRAYISIGLKRMPFGVWHGVDRLFNTLIPKPSHMMVIATKPS